MMKMKEKKKRYEREINGFFETCMDQMEGMKQRQTFALKLGEK